MQTIAVNVYAAKTHFSSLLEKVEAGEEITIARAGRPVARLVPVEPDKPVDRKTAFGALRGKIWVADDFDAWPPGFFDFLQKQP